MTARHDSLPSKANRQFICSMNSKSIDMKSTAVYKGLFYLLLVLSLTGEVLFAQNTNPTAADKHAEGMETNHIRVPNVLFSGVLLRNQEKNQTWYFPNVFEWFPANTVEGFVVNPQVKFTQHYNDGRFVSITPNVRYGFGNERLQAQLKIQHFYSPSKNAVLSLSGGRAMEQLYNESTLSALNNILYTFAYDQNFLKLYERSYVEVGHAFSPLKNFLLSTRVSWNERSPLTNLASFEEERIYTANNPTNIELSNAAFTEHQAVILEAELRWQIGHRLTKRRGQLVSEGEYPALTISYVNATDVILNGDVSYQKLSIGVQDEYKMGSAYGKWFVEAGDFLTKDQLTFVDFNHFKGRETVYGPYGNDQFQLLAYYTNSTADFYVQAHYEHHFSPLRKSGKSQIQPVAGIHYLYTDAGGHYVELGAGVDAILKFWRVDFYSSWREGKHESIGVRLGVTIE